MANSYVHAINSARIFGGVPEDYIKIHEFIDSSKQSFGDERHRAMYHHTHGPWICQEIFGHYIIPTNADGTPVIKNGRELKVMVREIAEKHIIEDLGCIPSPADWLNCLSCKRWMGGKKTKVISSGAFLEDVVYPPSVTGKE
jgi:hypothetical protein